jgi:hypothetical protein
MFRCICGFAGRAMHDLEEHLIDAAAAALHEDAHGLVDGLDYGTASNVKRAEGRLMDKLNLPDPLAEIDE